MGLEEITVSQDIDKVDDHDDEWVNDRSKPEVEFDDETSGSMTMSGSMTGQNPR